MWNRQNIAVIRWVVMETGMLCILLPAGCGHHQEPSTRKISLEYTKIAFVSYRDGNPDIYVMNADGSGQKNLTNYPAVDTDPAWSPDGRRIAFTSDRDGNDEIYVMNADGSSI